MGNTVLFGVDPQNDFGHPAGSLYCKGGYEIVGGGIILMEHALLQKWPIDLSADCHPPDSEHFKRWPPHCIRGTWGAAFLSGILDFNHIHYFDGDFNYFFKGTQKNEDGYDPFEGRNTSGKSPEEVMGDPAETTIIAWGIATNFCVRAFVLTARSKGYQVYVVLDACRAVPTSNNPPSDFITEKQAIEEMETAGAIMTTVEEVINGRI